MNKTYKTEKWFIKKQDENGSKYYQIMYIANSRNAAKVAVDNIKTYPEAVKKLEEIEKNPSKSPLSFFDKKFTKMNPDGHSKKYLEEKYNKDELKKYSKMAFSVLLEKIEEHGKNFIHQHDLENLKTEGDVEDFWFELTFFLDYLAHFDYVESYYYYTLGGKGFRNVYYKATEKGKSAFAKCTK